MIHILLTHVGGPHYEDTVRLRQRVLRDPLGLVLDASGDGARTFFVAVEDGVVVGTVALEGNRLRAMAVEGQTRGVGRLLVALLEEEARARGIPRIELHARITARGFYAKLGYTEHGDEFTEVTLPHIAMAKDLG
jgi:N-acetylglutamate synthase-like GNAT family acetyltransferase